MLFKKLYLQEKGFTLIELLIVILVLGVLAGAVIPNLGTFAKNSVVVTANQELVTLRSSIFGYLADKGEYPCDIQPTNGNPQPLSLNLINTYLGNAPIKGSYLVDNEGMITGDAANVYPGLVWDAATGNWVKQ